MMLFKQKVFAILVSVLLIALIFELVKRKKMREEYSWLWILTGSTILVCVVWYDLLVMLSALIGAVLPTTTLFILAILFLMLISLHFSVKISTLTNRVTKLSQDLALLKSIKE